MCGIFARVSKIGTLGGPKVNVSHRGPDAFFEKDFRVVDWQIHFAHWRLSIIDPHPHSNQPFSRSQDGPWVVFNGEIYNYRELRTEIGGNFQTASDTEVLLAAYEKWGVSCLDRLRGMFAFVIYDPKNTRLFAARDRFGIKPLYYRHTSTGVEFGSEIKQLLPPKPQANLNRIKDFLFYGSQDHTNETLFDGIFQIRGGEYALIELSDKLGLNIKSWYSLAKINPYQNDYESAIKDYREKFFEAVDLHLRSDVPLGFCLSGGMDSSAILAAASSILRDSIQTRTAIHCRFSGSRFDESQYAKEVAQSFRAHLLQVSPDSSNLAETLEKLTFYQDEPIHNASIISSYHVFRAGRESGLKVMLDGQGGDEQLASYPQFFTPYLLGLALSGRIGDFFSEANHFSNDHKWTLLDAIKSSFIYYGPTFITKGLKSLKSAIRPPRWLNRDFLLQNSVPSIPWKMCEDRMPTTKAMSLLMLRQTSLPMLLHWEDRNSMACSLESRVPFMDHELVELALGLPDQMKIHKGVTKRILKDSMSGLVPDRIIRRRDKMGFATPEENWLREEGGRSLCDQLSALPIDLKPIINEKGFQSCWNEFIGGGMYSPFLWRLIALQTWVRVFRVNF